MRLKDVLARYGTSALDVHAGGTRKPFNRDQLREDLEKVRKSREVAFFAAVGMLVVLFLICCGIVLAFAGKPSMLAAFLGASGLGTVGIIGIVTQTIQLWKERTASDILIAIAANVNDENLQTILDLLKPRL